MSPSSYTNTIFNQSARVLFEDCFLRDYRTQEKKCVPGMIIGSPSSLGTVNMTLDNSVKSLYTEYKGHTEYFKIKIIK